MDDAKILLLATQNRHKIEEITAVLENLNVEIRPVSELVPDFDVIEDGDTFEANALKKARAAFKITGIPSLADDSGLEVDFLLGRPGVYSSRFAGDEGNADLNNAKLLQMLSDTPDSLRTARFKTVMAFVSAIGESCVTGICEGMILHEKIGSEGFGYDPLFYYPEADKSFAQMSQEEKTLVSHRGRALRKISPVLISFFADNF